MNSCLCADHMFSMCLRGLSPGPPIFQRCAHWVSLCELLGPLTGPGCMSDPRLVTTGESCNKHLPQNWSQFSDFFLHEGGKKVSFFCLVVRSGTRPRSWKRFIVLQLHKRTTKPLHKQSSWSQRLVEHKETFNFNFNVEEAGEAFLGS